MANKKETSKDIEHYTQLDQNEDNRHNDNASAAAEMKPGYPRINTESL
ncbi:hypothetical protein H1D32_03960 [Anaerobacillus sp. CMMVII]|nr:hypothetical protein [Anaerobacillus sp. CMMVII]MCT8136964.1 hypothetical protein [Anaerobacillus sp. CMMVII]